MAEIGHVEVDPEGCRTGCGGEEQRRTLLRHQPRGVLAKTRPHGSNRQHIRQVQRMQLNPADIAVPITGQAAAPALMVSSRHEKPRF